VEKKDLEKIRQLAAKYTPKLKSRKTTPVFGSSSTTSTVTPSSFETPTEGGARRPTTGPTRRPGTEDVMHEMEDEARGKKEKQEDAKKEEIPETIVGLDAYMLRHTSEDNASFEELVEEGEKKRRIKWWWLHEAEAKAASSSSDIALEWRKALEGGCSNLVNNDNRPNQIEMWPGYKARNDVMYVPEGVGEISESPRPSKPREIVHVNTRLETCPFDEGKQAIATANAAAAALQAKAGKFDVDGKEVSLSETPQVNGFSFVSTPTPVPGAEESPFMTWGEIEGTPFRLDASDTPVPKTPGPAFVIPEIPDRDKLAFDLAERHSKSHRARKEKALNQIKSHPSQQSPFAGRLHTLSPAAQRLVDKQPGLGLKKGSDRSLLASYTPTPDRHGGDKTPVRLDGSARSKGTPRTPRTPTTPSSLTPSTTPRKKTIIAASGSLTRRTTPAAKTAKAPTPQTSKPTTPRLNTPKSLTDSLDLNIPTRRKASDYF